MQKVSLRNDFQRSGSLLCVGVIQCPGSCHRSLSFLRFVPNLFRTLDRTQSQVCNSLFDVRNTQVDASDHTHFVLENYPFNRRRKLAGFPFLMGFACQRPSFQGVPSWRGGRSFLVLSILADSVDRVSFHTLPFESTDLWLPISRNLHCFFLLCPHA